MLRIMQLTSHFHTDKSSLSTALLVAVYVQHFANTNINLKCSTPFPATLQVMHIAIDCNILHNIEISYAGQRQYVKC